MEKKEEPKVDLQYRQLGVWKLWTAKPSGKTSSEFSVFEDTQAVFGPMRRLFAEIYTILGPGLLTLFFLIHAWRSVQNILLLQFTSQLLVAVEMAMRDGKADRTVILNAVVIRLLCRTGTAAVDWQRKRTFPYIQSKIEFHYKEFLLQTQLDADVSSRSNRSIKTLEDASEPWKGFKSAVNYATFLISAINQLLFLRWTLPSSSGMFFALLSLVQPILMFSSMHIRVWQQPHITYSDNKDFVRMKALEKFVDEKYTKEVLSGGFGQYIVREYSKACAKLSRVRTSEAIFQLLESTSSATLVLLGLAEDLPIVSFALVALLDPSILSLRSLALLQQSSLVFRQTASQIIYQYKEVKQHMSVIKRVFSAPAASKEMSEGTVVLSADSQKESKGLAVEFRNVSFSYPGAQSASTQVLRDINLSIAPGQLVVLVGVNGSGKSTLLNLLMRLYDPSSGSLLINSLPIQEYTRTSLQQSTALLGQEHNIFPLSLYENIALGCHNRMHEEELVGDAVDKGGAQFVRDMEGGWGTVLEPVQTGTGNNIHDASDPVQVALKAKLKEMEKKIEISGGQRQRIVAARTFMRFHLDQIRLVAADEPSSALDPEGELELFNNLIAERKGKTMIFVTHRFGHLTRHADLIVCMKEGRILEKGTHKELMSLGGEYAGLYSVQASAFVEN